MARVPIQGVRVQRDLSRAGNRRAGVDGGVGVGRFLALLELDSLLKRPCGGAVASPSGGRLGFIPESAETTHEHIELHTTEGSDTWEEARRLRNSLFD